IVQLLLREYHLKMNHHGYERMLNELRQDYWVLKARTAIKRIWRECNYCKLQRAQPKPPLMGQLPKERLTPFLRPFTFCGVDYFGPMEVSVGRRREKRYGVLFSCLKVRFIVRSPVENVITN